MSSNGEMYVYSDHIPLETNGAAPKPGYEDGWDSVQGCLPHKREPALISLWVAPTQMVQVAQGYKWCSVCGDVRPLHYFDALYDPEGNLIGHNHECRMCVNSRDPKLAKEKFCSACKTMHPREDFADDDRYADGKYPSCRASEARRKTAGRARQAWLDEGRELRQWKRNKSVRQLA